MSTAPGAGIVRPLGINHVRLTVTDIERSKAFYARLFGRPPARDFSDETDAGDDPQRLYGGCGFAIEGQILGLRPVADPSDRFDSTRVGLDHVCFTLGSLAELRAAEQRLDAAGVPHGAYTELPGFDVAIVSLQDPDDINVELCAPL